jgi:DNA anti-recombination protein RmuC
VEPARSTWTDERLDDFRRDVSERFDRVDERFDQVDERFNQVDARFNQVDERFNQVDGKLHQLGTRIDAQATRIDALHRIFVQVGVAQVAAVLATMVTLLLKAP